MKTRIYFLTALMFLTLRPVFAQNPLNLQLGYLTEQGLRPGASIGLEYERSMGAAVSLPMRAEFGYLSTRDFDVLSVELSTGFRRYFENGIFVEQSVGLALAGTIFEPGGIWFTDQYENVVAYKDGPNWGVAPSVVAGLGYQWKDQHMIWVRPKIYWNLLVRGLDRPYTSLQIGYTYKLKH